MDRHANVDAETLNDLLGTSWVVKCKPGEMWHEMRFMQGGCAGKRDDPENSHIGLRTVKGVATGEESYTTERPARNPSPAELARELEDNDAQIYVPIQWVVAALDADSIEELKER